MTGPVAVVSRGVVVPVNPLLKAGELAYVWSDSGCRVAVVFAGFAEEAQKAAEQTGATVRLVDPAAVLGELAAHDPTTTIAPRADDDTAVVVIGWDGATA